MLSDHATQNTVVLTDEDRFRVDFYRLLALFLSAPPSAASLSAAAALEGSDAPLGRAIRSFARVAAQTDSTTADDEFHALFIGVGRGELLPYASYYLTGFLHEKPLARLRSEMAALGIAADPDASEPEDHAAAVLDMMAGLIDGSFGHPLTIADQKRFYDAHLGNWMPLFFRDLEGASSSVLYAALAQIGSRFLEIESAAFEMD
ncbi:MAG: molecular chaperone TorD family protein [Alphaproteobacteria bacterium]|nr:molecular chaperone TorD family protein [Alphaproteobacteria bacterium]